MRKSSLILAPLALLLAFNLAACGNKGPLVRPSADEIEDVEDVEDVEPASMDGLEADPDETPPIGETPVEDGDEDAGAEMPPPADPGHG